jgi:CheY-like chemotaxis protein
MADSPSAHRCTVLIVDDDTEVQEVLRVALVAEGYAVAVASTGREAIDYLRSHDATCAIVLDLMMPQMTGVQFRQIQLRDRSLAWIPTILMSAALDADQRARSLQPSALLMKPIDIDELRRAVAAAAGASCRRRGAPAELPRAPWR